MPVRKRKARPLSDEIAALDETLRAKMQYNELERRCLLVERDYTALRQRLVSLLLPEQIEAAKTCGVTPEMYALEWIDIHFRDASTKESLLYQIAPHFSKHLHGLAALKTGAYLK